MTNEHRNTAPAGRRRPYHHGALRSALIAAAGRLIAEHGTEGFTMADACRTAGVSTAAPYRHFADRDALLAAVRARGFDELSAQTGAARDARPSGSIEAIIAIGQAYVRFVTRDPELFHLMWSTPRQRYASEEAQASGRRCFGVLLEAVDRFRARQGREDIPTLSIAVPLWTMVHGVASLMLSDRIQGVAPGTDIDALVDRATRAFLSGLLALADGLDASPVDGDHERTGGP